MFKASMLEQRRKNVGAKNENFNFSHFMMKRITWQYVVRVLTSKAINRVLCTSKCVPIRLWV